MLADAARAIAGTTPETRARLATVGQDTPEGLALSWLQDADYESACESQEAARTERDYE